MNAVRFFSRHAELVSASMVPPSTVPGLRRPVLAAEWTLKQVQGDERGFGVALR